MSNLAYLLIALALSVVLSVGMWLARYRKPKTFMSSIDDFSREMKALGGDVDSGPAGRRRARPDEPAGRPSDEFDPTEERRS